jgi:hypothetical protein
VPSSHANKARIDADSTTSLSRDVGLYTDFLWLFNGRSSSGDGMKLSFIDQYTNGYKVVRSRCADTSDRNPDEAIFEFTSPDHLSGTATAGAANVSLDDYGLHSCHPSMILMFQAHNPGLAIAC